MVTNVNTKQTKKQAGLLEFGSGAAALASGFASLQASSMQSRQFKIEGIFMGLQASAEKLKARENAVFLRRRFLQDLGSSNASFAARGVSTGSGIGRQTTIQGLKTLSEDIKASELNSESAQLQLKLNSSQAKLGQRTSKNLGLLSSSKSFARGAQGLLTGFKTIKQAGGSNE